MGTGRISATTRTPPVQQRDERGEPIGMQDLTGMEFTGRALVTVESNTTEVIAWFLNS